MRKIILPILLFISICSLSQNESFSYLATSTTGDIVVHTYYTLSYDEDHEQAEWVAYKLTRNMIEGDIERTNDFRSDPGIKTESAQLSDYKGSGYDRGHLAPAADMKINEIAMSESFYMSNVSPQVPDFNRNIWKFLEMKVRSWVMNKGDLFVVTGGILDSIGGTIGENKVTIPKYYYKAILYVDNEDDYKTTTIAFLLPNKKSDKSLEEFVVPVDYIEGITDIDFFAFLPEKIEREVEGKLNTDVWFSSSIINLYVPSTTKTTTKSSSSSSSTSKSTYNNTTRSTSVRCSATTQKGTRCKRMTTNSSGRCWQH